MKLAVAINDGFNNTINSTKVYPAPTTHMSAKQIPKEEMKSRPTSKQSDVHSRLMNMSHTEMSLGGFAKDIKRKQDIEDLFDKIESDTNKSGASTPTKRVSFVMFE